jgi:hypothetical protein
MFSFDGKPESSMYPCPECATTHVRSAGFVVKDGSAYAVFHSYLHGSHDKPGGAVATFTVIFADWARSQAKLIDAVAFGAFCRPGPGDYDFTLHHPQVRDIDDVRYLSRQHALDHHRKHDFWDVVDFVITADPRTRLHLYGR